MTCSPVRSRIGACLLAAVALMTGRSALALDVESVTWGFDGRFVPMTFNPVTITVSNNSRDPYEGDVALIQGSSAMSGDQLLIETGVYIEPFGVRDFQFFPFVADQWIEFSIGWGNNLDQRMRLDPARTVRFGPPATVLLRDAALSRQQRVRLPTFDEQNFPISVSGTDGLKAVVLDHVPRWDSLRQQALRDWVQAGGTVHLMQDDTGAFPRFAPPLEVFNEPTDAFDVGAGHVFRHPRSVASIDDDFVAQTLGIDPTQWNPDPSAMVAAPYQVDYQWSTPRAVAPMLRSLTRPNHNWPLIYLLSFVYLGVVFPGCWLIGRRRADFRITYPILLGAVVLFSLAFKTVGQRGYGEETAWNVVGTARPLGEGRWLTECWSNVFVTSGGEASFTHEADGLLYSTGGENESTRGRCTNRPNASCTLDIPPFSSVTMVHSGVMKGPALSAEVTSVDLESTPPRFEITMQGTIPSGTTARIIYDDDVYAPSINGQKYTAASATPLSTFLQPNGYGYAYNYNGYNADPSGTTIYDSAEMPLIAKVLKIGSDQTRENFHHPKDRVLLLLFAPAPEEFLQVANGPPKRQGRILYEFDLPLEPTPVKATEAPAAGGEAAADAAPATDSPAQ